MDKLPYRNIPGSMQHVEKWMEKMLAVALEEDDILHAGQEPVGVESVGKDGATEKHQFPAMHQYQLDRESLEQLGIDKEMQDKIYRTYFIYCNGMHDFIKDFSRFGDDIPSKMWITFIRLFQYYDPKFQQNFAAFIKKQQDETAIKTISEQSVLISSLQAEVKSLYEDLTIARADASGYKHEEEMSLLTSSILETNLRQTVQHYREQLSVALKRIEGLEQCRTQYKDHLSSCREIILKLAKELATTEKRAIMFATKCEGLEKEYEELLKKFKGNDANYQKLVEELGRYKDKAMNLTQARDELFELTTNLNAEKKQLRQQIESLQSNRTDLLAIQTELVALVNTSNTILSHAAMQEGLYHEIGESIREHCLEISRISGSAGVGFDDSGHDPHSAHIVISQLNDHVKSIEQNTIRIDSKVNVDITINNIREVTRHVNQVKDYLQAVEASSFLRNQLDNYKCYMHELAEKTAAYSSLWQQHVAQQGAVSTANLLSAVYRATSDTLQDKCDALTVELSGQNAIIHERDTTIAGLNERIEYLETFKARFEELEPRHLLLVDTHDQLQRLKDRVDIALEESKQEVEALLEVKEQYRSATRTIRNLQVELADREEHIKYLQGELRRVSALVTEQTDISNEFDGILTAIAEAVDCAVSMVEHGESCNLRNKNIFDDDAVAINEQTVLVRLVASNLRPRVEDVAKSLRLNSEPFVVDEGDAFTVEERERMRRIVRSLSVLPIKVLCLLRFMDELRVEKEKVRHWQRECEHLKTFSAKERSRLTRLVLPNAATTVAGNNDP